MSKITIVVTAEDIAKGERGADLCPIALAAQRAFTDEHPLVSDREIDTDDGSYELPARARNFIQLFDNGKPVKPFRFTVAEAKR